MKFFVCGFLLYKTAIVHTKLYAPHQKKYSKQSLTFHSTVSRMLFTDNGRYTPHPLPKLRDPLQQSRSFGRRRELVPACVDVTGYLFPLQQCSLQAIETIIRAIKYFVGIFNKRGCARQSLRQPAED